MMVGDFEWIARVDALYPHSLMLLSNSKTKIEHEFSERAAIVTPNTELSILYMWLGVVGINEPEAALDAHSFVQAGFNRLSMHWMDIHVRSVKPTAPTSAEAEELAQFENEIEARHPDADVIQLFKEV